MDIDVLQSIAETPPHTYLDTVSDSNIDEVDHRPATQCTVLASLYKACCEKQIVPSDSYDLEDGIDQLHAIFDVALHYGLGAVIMQYMDEMCYTPHPTLSRDPVKAAFVRPSCVESWLRKQLKFAHRKLMSLVQQAFSDTIAADMIPNDVGALSMLEMVAETLASEDHKKGTGEGRSVENQANTSRLHEMMSKEAHFGIASGVIGRNELVVEVKRLLQCSLFMAHIIQIELRNSSSSSSFSSENYWENIVEHRREVSKPSPLFVDGLIDVLTKYGIEDSLLQYPPKSLGVIVSNVLLNGDSSDEALEAKLAFLGYCLVDGNFLTAQEVADFFHRAFRVKASRTLAYIVLLFLDDAQLKLGEDHETNVSLSQAHSLLPSIDVSVLPYKAMQVFANAGMEAVALGLLRQRSSEISDIDDARIALKIRLSNGLLVESFLEMKRYLRKISSDESRLAEESFVLIKDMLDWGLEAQSLHGIIRLPIQPGPEEDSLKEWLRSKVQTVPHAVIMLVLFDLFRGRIPEALYSYQKFSKYLNSENISATENAMQEENSGYSGEMIMAAKDQLEGLLSSASRMLPAIQRSMVVLEGEKSNLVVDNTELPDSARTDIGTSLGKAVPGVEVDESSRLIAVGKSPLSTPLLGGITAIDRIENIDRYRQKEKPTDGRIVAPPLFSSSIPQSKERQEADTDNFKSTLFGNLKFASGDTTKPSIDSKTTAFTHELDRLLGSSHGISKGQKRVTRLSKPPISL